MAELSRRVPADIRRVEGCNCGGLNAHELRCSFWTLPPEEQVANRDDALRRLDGHVAQLNTAQPPDLEDRHARQLAERQVIGQLLKGGVRLFGKPIALAWPEGLPNGMTEDDLRKLGETWAP